MSFFSAEITYFWCSKMIFVGTLSFVRFTEGFNVSSVKGGGEGVAAF